MGALSPARRLERSGHCVLTQIGLAKRLFLVNSRGIWSSRILSKTAFVTSPLANVDMASTFASDALTPNSTWSLFQSDSDTRAQCSGGGLGGEGFLEA